MCEKNNKRIKKSYYVKNHKILFKKIAMIPCDFEKSVFCTSFRL